jgi:elongation factor P--(R)-beta-lysine ligase
MPLSLGSVDRFEITEGGPGLVPGGEKLPLETLQLTLVEILREIVILNVGRAETRLPAQVFLVIVGRGVVKIAHTDSITRRWFLRHNGWCTVAMMTDHVRDTFAVRRDALRRRAGIIAAIRHFFDRRDYLAVETPQLSATPIPEAHIELFTTGEGLYLLPSPEFHLKRLLAAGAGDLYEITHSFRNGEEIGPYHRREFTMLEYYTVGADAARSLEITRELLAAVASAAAGVRGAGARPGPEPADTVISMAEAWRRHTGIDLERTIGADGVTGDAAALAAEAARAGLTTDRHDGEEWEDLFQRIFLTFVEPELPRDRPVYLTHYPAAVPTLARRIPGTPWADRWELYLGGMEVANCFGEETDPAVIAAFLRDQAGQKRVVGHREHPWDASFLQDPPLPACSGVALGVDRLVMHLLDAANIADVLAIPDAEG